MAIYKASNTKKALDTIPTCDGEGTVLNGINLWFGSGGDGKVKQEI